MGPGPERRPPSRPAAPRRVPGAPSNAFSPAQYTLAQLKAMADSRGLSVEKLLAQMVQQYLKEDREAES